MLNQLISFEQIEPNTTLMRAYITSFMVLLTGLLFIFIISCKKETTKVEPTVSVSAITNITANSASAGGDVTSDGGAGVTARGICWSSTNSTPTTSDNTASGGAGTGNFSSSISGLTQGTTYSIRAYATNSVGTAYSSASSFKTLALAPTLTTTDISSVMTTSLNSGGNVTNDGGSPVSARGVCWSTNQNPTISDSKTSNGTGTGNFTSTVTGLQPGITYYLRAYATNSIGTAYGNQVTIKTTASLPSLTTVAITNITTTSATCGGNITSDGGGVIMARGVCWSTSANPTIANNKSTEGAGIGSFTSTITQLTANTTYYVRAYVTNVTGTAYGNQESFVTNYGSMTDIDGNIYPTIKIGTQVWAKENLKVTKLKDGTTIPLITDNVAWINLSTTGYCWYNNDEATNKNLYGALYNWLTVNTGKLCPTGWRVANDSDWTILADYLTNNGYGYQGSGNDIAKSMASTSGWTTYVGFGNVGDEMGSNNSSGYSALPGGIRQDQDGKFVAIGTVCYWWTPGELDVIDNVVRRALACNSSYLERSNGAGKNGFGVRCLYGSETTHLTVTTSPIVSLTTTSAVSGGNIGSNGVQTITERGVCWNTTSNPTIANSKTVDGMGTGSFTSSMTNLSQGTTYYVRAYATSSAGTEYGNEISFTTAANFITLTTISVSSIMATTAISGGNIAATGEVTITARGVCWSTHQTPSVSDSKTAEGTGLGNYTSIMNGLTANTKYYVRSYATGLAGTVYGNEISFTTVANLTTITTTSVSSITTTTATSGGNITATGGGTITSRGICWSTHQAPVLTDNKTIDGSGIGIYTSAITGLTPNTKYYVRSYATNTVGTTYGNELSFTTMDGVLYKNTAWIIDQNNEYQMVGLHTNNSMIGIKINPEKNTEYTAIFRKTSTDSPGILVKINSDGLPYQIYVNDNILVLGNFTSTSVDIVVIRPGKNNETLRKVNIQQLASLKKFKKSLYVGGEVNASDIISTVGIALSVGTCAVEVAGAISSGGLLAPMAAIGCGMAIVDVIAAFDTTNDTELQKIYNTNSYVGTAFNFFGCVKLNPVDCIGLYNSGLGFVASAAEKAFQDEKDKINTANSGFNVDSSIPIVDTLPITNILSTSAVSGVNIVSNGGHSIIAKGVCWSTSPSPTIANSKSSDGAGDAVSPSAITGLTPGTKYYVRAYATNSEGTAYGQEISFTAGPWQIIQEEISISGSANCWVYNGGQKVNYNSPSGITLWAFKGDIVSTNSGTTLEVYYYKYNDEILTVRQDPVAVKLEINGNLVKLSFTSGFEYVMMGQMNNDKTEINGVGTFTQIMPPSSNCDGWTATGSANCKILIPH